MADAALEDDDADMKRDAAPAQVDSDGAGTQKRASVCDSPSQAAPNAPGLEDEMDEPNQQYASNAHAIVVLCMLRVACLENARPPEGCSCQLLQHKTVRWAQHFDTLLHRGVRFL